MRLVLIFAALLVLGCGGAQRDSVNELELTVDPALPARISTLPNRPSPADSTLDPTSDLAEGTRRQASKDERRLIERLARAAESVRELRFVSPVDVQIEDDVAITRSLLGQLKDDDIKKAQTVYTAIGLLPANIDLFALLAGVLSEQVVGYYDPDSKRLVVRDDVIAGLRNGSPSAESSETRLVLIHELVHALQDQQLDLGKQHNVERDSDQENAFRSVIEGDATLAMMAHLLRGQGLPLHVLTSGMSNLGSILQSDALLSGESLNDAPPIVRVTLVAPYLRGLQWAAAVHAKGGWRAVDRAHKRGPANTEQILHPEKFFTREKDTNVILPKMPFVDREGYTIVDEDTLGELEISVYFGQFTASGVDELSASGWSGDRLAVYSRGNVPMVVWFTAWDSVTDAERALLAAKRVSPPLDRNDVVRVGRAVLIVRNGDRRTRAPLLKTFTEWSSTL